MRPCFFFFACLPPLGAKKTHKNVWPFPRRWRCNVGILCEDHSWVSPSASLAARPSLSIPRLRGGRPSCVRPWCSPWASTVKRKRAAGRGSVCQRVEARPVRALAMPRNRTLATSRPSQRQRGIACTPSHRFHALFQSLGALDRSASLQLSALTRVE